MSTIKVDTIATRTGSGNITLSNNVASLTSAGAISGTNLTASGTLGVTGTGGVSGGTAAVAYGDADDLVIGNGSGNRGMSIYTGTSNAGSIYFSDASSGTGQYDGYISYNHNNRTMVAYSGINYGLNVDGVNKTVRLTDGGTQRLRIDNDGIKFGTDSASVNALDDYEEGTFTPTLVDSAGDLSPNYTFQAGQYTKVGNKVTFALRINSNSHDSDGDQLYIGGLPFAINFTNTSNRSYVPVDGNGFNIDAGSGYYKLVGQLTNTNQSITLLQQGDNNSQDNFRANSLQQTKEIYITGTYFTNS